MTEPDFGKTFFPAENAGNRRFCRFSSAFFLIFLCFFTQTLLITMPTIKHDSNVNKTDFWTRNFLKIAGTADFRRKNGISWITRAALYVFSWNFAHWCKIVTSRMWLSPIFEKKFFFRPKMPEICRKNRFFGHFLPISSLVFSDFLHKDAF